MHYAIKAICAEHGLSGMSNEITLAGYSGVMDNSIAAAPKRFSLAQNYPNPFNPNTEIFYSIPKHCEVKLAIYAISGQLVRSLVNDRQSAGYYSATWNGKDNLGKSMPGGVYVYTLSAGDYCQSKRMILLK